MTDPRILIRPLAPGDEEALYGFFAGLSVEAVRMRFGGGRIPRRSEIEQFTHSDQQSRVHLIALGGDTGELIGHAMYVVSASDPTEADAGWAVADRWRRQGVGSALYEAMAAQAYKRGVRRFTALVEAANRPMNSWLERHGATRLETEMGQTDWVLGLDEPV
jgi:GNAT superfamily N-acetyltransferase